MFVCINLCRYVMYVSFICLYVCIRVAPWSIMMVDNNKIRCGGNKHMLFFQCLLFNCDFKHTLSGGSTYIRGTVYKIMNWI